jgi:nucleotide-binding universal stress UspA family protein
LITAEYPAVQHLIQIQMKTILIPVDFSETSANALAYATELIKDIEVERIILLKIFYKSIYEQLLPSVDFVQLSAEDIQAERDQISEQLKTLTDGLQKKCNPTIKIQTAVSELPLLRSIHQLIAEEHPDLLIIGSDPIAQQAETYIGQQVIGVAKTSPIPVLIVPAGATYQKIERALVPCDFTMVSRLGILKGLHSPLEWLHPELMILNIDPQQKHISHEAEHAGLLNELLEGYTYRIYYAADQHKVQGILNFAQDNNVQLITALPGKYSFFYQFTHSSTTEALTVNSLQPVLILK